MEDIYNLVNKTLEGNNPASDTSVGAPLLLGFGRSGTITPEGAPSLSSPSSTRQEPALSDQPAGGSRMGGSVDSVSVDSYLGRPRLEWSRWVRCESSFSVLLVPAKPGIFALGEEMVPALSDAFDAAPEGRPSLAQRFSAGNTTGTISVPEGRPNAAGKRMIALFHISDADDLGMALGRLFLPGNPLLAKLNAGRCFVRYAVIEDSAQRSVACAAFRRWMNASAEIASGIQQDPCGAGAPGREAVQQYPCGSVIPVRPQSVTEIDYESSVRSLKDNSPSTSSAWGVGFMEAPNRETKEVSRRPTPLPSGF